MGFVHTKHNPLHTSALCLDEASMLDTRLARDLFEAIPTGARLVLMGDVDQLPSVGAGAVLRDIIASTAVPTVRLTRIFRQRAGSRISQAAACVNAGQQPTSEVWPTRPQRDGEVFGEFFIRECRNGIDAQRMVVELVAREIPARFGFDSDSIQVLTPMRKGAAGSLELNDALVARLNPEGPSFVRGAAVYRVGDRVLVTRNDYKRDVFNGDQGVVLAINQDGTGLLVNIDGREVAFSRNDMEFVLHARAITTHKFQGSEAPAVVVVLLREHMMLLSRNHFYTSLSRGKKLVVVVGDPSAIKIALSETRRELRHTGLAAKLRAEGPRPGLVAGS